jgi:hypothetical protein
MSRDAHPSAEDLEVYAMGRSLDVDIERIQTHLLICDRCQMELAQSDHYIRAVKCGAALLEATRQFRSVHFTEDGLIFGASHERADGKWVARHWGKQLQGMRVCDSVEEANAYLRESFQQMFPEHVCSERCIEESVKAARMASALAWRPWRTRRETARQVDRVHAGAAMVMPFLRRSSVAPAVPLHHFRSISSSTRASSSRRTGLETKPSIPASTACCRSVFEAPAVNAMIGTCARLVRRMRRVAS